VWKRTENYWSGGGGRKKEIGKYIYLRLFSSFISWIAEKDRWGKGHWTLDDT
jgi:hypothetical protein